MKSLLIYHHLGLGDHIMCHGIVRTFAKKYDKVGLFCLPHNLPSVAFMYRDLKNLTVIQGDNAFAEKTISENDKQPLETRYKEVKIIGFNNLNRQRGVSLEKQFYALAGMNVAEKWNNFYVERDLIAEKKLQEKVNLKKPYVFLHDDIERSYIIKRKLINKKYEIFTPKKELTRNFFDYCTIIENASEIHVFDSSFMFLIDCLPYTNRNQKLFVHRYARENNDWQLPILKKDWYIFNAGSSIFDPLKEFLESLVIKSSFLKRVIRWIFRKMAWPMGRPQHPNLEILVQRYSETGENFISRIPLNKGMTAKKAEENLVKQGLIVREKQIFKTEACFVCKK